MNPFLLLTAFAAGAAISVQAAVNSRLAAGLGGNTVAAGFLSFLVGTVALAAIAVGKGGLASAVASLPGQPAWRFTGGLLGAAAIFCTVLLAPRIGIANMLALVIMGQLFTSLAIDQFGIAGMAVRPLTGVKVAGAAVILGGVLLTLFGDRAMALLARQG
ncbi:DMT family transporter [Cupriavidus sp. 30B13]|uniref:DMT family transporter n=1 Tax=Cupriavidus sp. 30B13 TaxID=3384241 RepID=UPI003B900A06